jgi:sulfur carrier protein
VTAPTTVTLNGEPSAVGSPATVGSIVDGLGRGRRGISVAVNAVLVPRSAWDDAVVHEGDRVEVLTAVQGG